jgi:radical SAM superfamily enzyme YgiQ (UPF0313 family)
MNASKNSIYRGAETGPIRPPSEAESLMLRVTRNCPWNKCRFCLLYKDTSFSIRRLEHVFADIAAIAACIGKIEEVYALYGKDSAAASAALNAYASLGPDSCDTQANAAHAMESALRWYASGMKSVFLQDANSLLVKTDELAAILTRLREVFPSIERITSYARSQTVVDKGLDALRLLHARGLNRIHIGMESGSDRILEFVNKGASKEIHIRAGELVKQAGIELSEYYILGLGGVDMSAEHTLESADALNRIDPDFIRVRTLTIPGILPLANDVKEGRFVQQNDIQGAEELLLLIENLNVHSCLINNDHILCLLPDASGKLPEEKERMTASVRRFLTLQPEEQLLYRVGRRCAHMGSLEDLSDSAIRESVHSLMRRAGINEANADMTLKRVMLSYI